MSAGARIARYVSGLTILDGNQDGEPFTVLP